jgi:hypothetical protein
MALLALVLSGVLLTCRGGEGQIRSIPLCRLVGSVRHHTLRESES